MMHRQLINSLTMLGIAVASAAAPDASGQSLGATITYQGRLQQSGEPATGPHDMTFTLHSHPTNVAPVGAPLDLLDVPVEAGLFTVELDFGAGVFVGQGRWLEIEVEGVVLAPRQPVRPAPHALALPGMRTVQFASSPAVLGGHVANIIGVDGWGATISGGGLSDFPNRALGVVSSIGGGSDNAATAFGATIGGGIANAAGGEISTVGGGGTNIANGVHSTIPGGGFNRALGDYSFAAGRKAGADHHGAFVWADSTGVDFLSTGDNQFLIRAGGGVGIGTNAPASALHVVGADNNGIESAVRISTGTQVMLIDGNEIDTDSSTGLFFNHNVPHKVVIADGGGNVGIGTSDPSFRLHVNGSAGKPGGGSWSNSSDRRLKKNIRDLEGALDSLLALRGVTFEYRDPGAINELPGERLGMIAQEVEDVFSDWIDEGEDGFKRLTYRGFEALTVEALRELRAEKDAEIDALRDENAELRARLEALESAVQQLMATQEGAVR